MEKVTLAMLLLSAMVQEILTCEARERKGREKRMKEEEGNKEEGHFS
jgi:hypothetical protein